MSRSPSLPRRARVLATASALCAVLVAASAAGPALHAAGATGSDPFAPLLATSAAEPQPGSNKVNVPSTFKSSPYNADGTCPASDATNTTPGSDWSSFFAAYSGSHADVEVDFPAGCYYFSPSYTYGSILALTGVSNVLLQGNVTGGTADTSKASLRPASDVPDSRTFLSVGSGSRVELANFDLVGNKAHDGNGSGAGGAISVGGPSPTHDVTITGNKIDNFLGDGVYVTNGFTSTVPKGNAPTSNVTVENNFISRIGRVGVSIVSGTNYFVHNNAITAAQQQGVDIEPNSEPLPGSANQITIQGNIIWGLVQPGSSDPLTINANTWDQEGMSLTISDLTIADNYADHLRIHVGGFGGERRVAITGNHQADPALLPMEIEVGGLVWNYGSGTQYYHDDADLEYVTVAGNTTPGSSATISVDGTCPLQVSGNTAAGAAVGATNHGGTCATGWQDSPGDLDARQFAERTEIRTLGRSPALSESDGVRDFLRNGGPALNVLVADTAFPDSQKPDESGNGTSYANRFGGVFSVMLASSGTLPVDPPGTSASYAVVQGQAELAPGPYATTYPGHTVLGDLAAFLVAVGPLNSLSGQSFVSAVDTNLGHFGSVGTGNDSTYVADLATHSKGDVLVEMATAPGTQTAIANSVDAELAYTATLGQLASSAQFHDARAAFDNGESLVTFMGDLLNGPDYASQMAPFSSCTQEGIAYALSTAPATLGQPTLYNWCTT